jgi:hypothetical protein
MNETIDTSNQALPTRVESNDNTTESNSLPTGTATLTVVSNGLDAQQGGDDANVSKNLSWGGGLDYDAESYTDDPVAYKALAVGLIAGAVSIFGLIAYKLLF